jgi:signal transduction histidine kinase
MATFELRPQPKSDRPEEGARTGLGVQVLLNNVRWFTRLRWAVIGVLAAGGAAHALAPEAFAAIGAAWSSRDLGILVALLLVANVVFQVVAVRLGTETPRSRVLVWLWAQILFDLAIVTGLVHTIGSVATFVPFTYLFHIALACIFFPQRHSLFVALAAAALYAGLVLGETLGFLPPGPAAVSVVRGAPMRLFFAASTIVVWLVVWYLVSTLSETVRVQDERLRTANAELRQAYHEKNQQVLITTHDLKAPFAGIETNIDLLKYRLWDKTPQEVQDIIERIDLRAQVLSARIKDILILGDLRSRADGEHGLENVDLAPLLNSVLEQLGERAGGRNVAVYTNVPSLTITGDREQLAVLFENLISNAIAYSQEGSSVEIECRAGRDEVGVLVRDHGIGIREDALPHIFDEYYRTNEAARHNRLSTGLGLAIVKEVATRFGLTISVTSEVGQGTEFEVVIPRGGRSARGREEGHGGKDQDSR